jgi:putative transcriptional regulator
MISKGSILISEPFLGDNNFRRSVILICDHNDQGTFGYILNKPTAVQISSVMEGLNNFEANLYIGGPVSQNSVHFIHRSGVRMQGDIEITKNVFWGADFEELKLKLLSGEIAPEDVRFFVGYSGWGEGQLENELLNNSWIIGSASSDEIFETEPEKFWRAILKNMGGKYKMFANYPIDPRLN